MDLDTSDLDAQIAALQAAKATKLAKAEAARRVLEKEEAKVLIGSTPTKATLKEKAKNEAVLPSRPAQPNFGSSSTSSRYTKPASVAKPTPQPLPSIPSSKPSSLSSSLAALRRSNSSSSKSPQTAQPTRSVNLSQKTTISAVPSIAESSSRARDRSPESEYDDNGKGKAKEPLRDEDSLTIIEKLELGPKEFGRDPEGEEEWRDVEPNSGIRLSKRILPHSHLQDHLSGRYYIPPSTLYSVIRLSRDGTTYDIPVDGDWITIAVVAHRGEVKVSGTKDASVESDDDEDEGEVLDTAVPKDGKVAGGANAKKSGEKGKDKAKGKKAQRRRVPRKYINMTLCSLPSRNRSLGKSTGTSGDALLNLLLFEADAVVHERQTEDGEMKRSYRGGSGGAYEKWCNLNEGSVVAILNPRVWRNLRGGGNNPHPLEFPLGLNPTSGDSIALIGQARDLGYCTATQKDGNRCKSWVDLRQGAVCEYHVHAAIQRGKGSRAEFTASTSSFALTSRPANGAAAKGKGYDPHRKTGLIPGGGPQAAPRGVDNGGGGATYVIGGGVINTGAARLGGLKGFGNEFLSEKLGRNRAGKRKRQLEEKEAEKALERLLESDTGSTGGKYLNVLERERVKEAKLKQKESGGEAVVSSQEREEKKRPFNALAIRRIGFDPTARTGQRDGEDLQKRLEAISALKGQDPGCRLERLSKRLEEEKQATAQSKRVKVSAPAPVQVDDEDDEEGMIDLD
ncbi:hypothetical protein CI109_106375 [Kwoniella shandongensis]|uniref:Zinc finger Mcm10/DnaG-type domain-containing protein n=1 Tax=Kwoniella shandongensis TaxID=1734106 RepID=A0A5M6BW15_9TREE|nr:uncharacterized protein CI109_005918 [Kwoniella shandongensis]KAA5525755.1 hypothetical protein CI109_005918 [Kwoniella shandongensis]